MTTSSDTFWEIMIIRTINGLLKMSVFAFTFWVLRDVVGISEPWALGMAVVYTLAGPQ
jgi:hypothetical protein